MRAYLDAAKVNYVSAEVFFRDKKLIQRDGEEFYLLPSKGLRDEVAERFEKAFFVKHDETRLLALKSGMRADFSQLQSFYIGLNEDGGYKFSCILTTGGLIHYLGKFTWSALHWRDA